MPISLNALALIKEFEGLRLKAYIDPVGIPTIGYGTIRYPDGNPVEMGDSISEAEAEAYLKFECDRLAEKVAAALGGPSANQNQFDALVSFTYNVGIGAFLGSTLLAKLKRGDVDGAADEFPRWNKGTVDGIRTELPGLTARRRKERALFLKKAGAGRPLDDSPSDQERIIEARGFREGEAQLVVGFDGSGRAVEIVALANALPATFVSLLETYPSLKRFGFAAPGEPVPAGPRRSYSGLARPVSAVANAPRLERPLLALGAEDSEDVPGNDVREMQARLRELGYYAAVVDGVFGPLTDAAARAFQADHFGAAEADGLVGPKTWAKLWGEVQPQLGGGPAGPAIPGKTYLKLTRTEAKDSYGLVVLDLAYVRDGLLADRIEVCSGHRRKQTFRPGRDSPTGSMEPLPEGRWFIRDIEWAAGKDNYEGEVWNNGLGPAKIRLDYKGPGRTARSAIEIHIDWNRRGAPGTAGCVGVQNVADFRRLAGWLRETDPRDLFVDWGLGTCPTP